MSKKIVVGRFGSPYGIKGWIKVISFTDPKTQILEYKPWYIQSGDTQKVIELINSKLHGNNLVAQIAQCFDRNEAATYTNLDILIERGQLPQLSNDEYYWVDLVGLIVLNLQQELLGKVEELFSTGSNDVLIVIDDSGKQRYIPYIDNVIIDVDLAARKLVVDWDASF